MKRAATVPEIAPVSLEIRLFGPWDVRVEGKPIPRLRSHASLTLLALLALHQGLPPERVWLAATLWPDSEERQALYNLRRNLTDLRHAFGPAAARLVSPTSRTLSLPLSSSECDLIAFDAAIARGDIAALEEAVMLYRGPLLESLSEAWILPEREARQHAYLNALETLAARAMEQRDPTRATAYLQRLIALDPTRETAQRALMTALAESGNTAAVTQAYRDLRFTLRRDLNAEPDGETVTLYRRLRAEGSTHARTTTTVAPTPSGLPPHRLPTAPTALIGREREIEEVLRCLDTARLVTLTGTGGVGKTRLALAVAEKVANDFPDGAFFVDATPLTSSTLLWHEVATAMSVTEENGRPLRETFQAALQARALLIVLDNCEHLIEECAHLADALLQNCPGLRILATSRQSLRIGGERVWHVPSLAVPPLSDGRKEEKSHASSLLEYEAIRLFVERATWANAAFRLTPQNAEAVAQICRRLDGIPLALELAAAQMPGLNVAQIAAHLDDRFRLLTRGSRTAPTRQQTLRATLDWSYELLTDSERRLLRRLSVFQGSWTLDAAEQACSTRVFRYSGIQDNASPHQNPLIRKHPNTQTPEHLNTEDVLDLLISLVDKSLIQVEEPGDASELEVPADGVRYRLLETVRQYGRERLQEAEEEASVQELHSAYFCDLVEQLHARPGQEVWYQGLGREYENVRAALEWSLSRPDLVSRAIHTACLLDAFWKACGYLQEAWEWWSRALASSRDIAPSLHTRALWSAATLALLYADYETIRRLWEECIAVAREAGDKSLLARAYLGLGVTAHRHGDLEQAQALCEQALTAAREAEDRANTASALFELGISRVLRGDITQARSYAEESLRLFREIGDPLGMARALQQLASLLKDHGGDLTLARHYLEQSLALYRKLGERIGVASALAGLGDLLRSEGDLAGAHTLLRESLAVGRELRDRMGIAHALLDLGTMAEEAGDLAAAQTMLEESLALRRQIGERNGAARVLLHLGNIRRLQEDLPGARTYYAESLAIGREAGDEEVVARAHACLKQEERSQDNGS